MKNIWFLILVLIFTTSDAWACPVCFDAKGGTLNAFRFSAFLLSVVPLTLFASFFFWYRNKAKSLDS